MDFVIILLSLFEVWVVAHNIHHWFVWQTKSKHICIVYFFWCNNEASMAILNFRSGYFTTKLITSKICVNDWRVDRDKSVSFCYITKHFHQCQIGSDSRQAIVCRNPNIKHAKDAYHLVYMETKWLVRIRTNTQLVIASYRTKQWEPTGVAAL